MRKFLNEWKASVLGTLLLLFLSVIPNILTLGILGIIANRRYSTEIYIRRITDEVCKETL